jgi:hypothetical protein
MSQVIQNQDYSRDITNVGTTVSMASNFDVALYTLKKSPLFGSGFGGHETMYHRRFQNNDFKNSWFYGLNYNSGHSLIIRVLSELGLIGFILIIYIIFSRYIKSSKSKVHHFIALACISHLICKSFKLGGYFDYGTPFFFCVLLVNHMNFKSWLSKPHLSE